MDVHTLYNMHINFRDIWNSNTILFRWFKVGRLNWRTSCRASLHGAAPSRCRTDACGAATLSCRAMRAGAAKRVISANNIFEVLFLKIN
jgi:hypothetical protein